MSFFKGMRQSNRLATLFTLMLDEIELKHSSGAKTSVHSKINPEQVVPVPSKKSMGTDITEMFVDSHILSHMWYFNYCMVRMIIKHPTCKLKINRKRYYEALNGFLKDQGIDITNVSVRRNVNKEQRKVIRDHIINMMSGKVKNT